MIIRHANIGDIDALLALSATVDGGMTSMPVSRETWEKKLEFVAKSLRASPSNKDEKLYFLVLEDPHCQQIVGTAGIHAKVGFNRPFYNYKLSKHVKASEALGITVTSNILNLVNDFSGETELTSLFLTPDYRRDKLGQFLSRSRFMLMHDFPELFGDMVFAEVRGWLDKDGLSPFWEHLGKKFFNMPYQKADFISGVDGSQFISDLMPRFPIYLELLPQEAVAVVGKPHTASAAAMKLLEKEGFQYQGAVDIFDAGPVVQCQRQYIESIKHTRSVTVESLNFNDTDSQRIERYIVSHGVLDEYRLTVCSLKWLDENHIALTSSDAALLNVQLGSRVQVLSLR